MTHGISSCKTCDWCGEMEPEAGSFSRTGDRHRDTVLCPDCCPDDEVEKGVFINFTFTAHREQHTVVESVENYLEASDTDVDYWLVEDLGLRTSMNGHGRYSLVISSGDGLSHYGMRGIMKLEGIINASNGDPERNNCRAKFYNYNILDAVLNPEDIASHDPEPEVVATNTGD